MQEAPPAGLTDAEAPEYYRRLGMTVVAVPPAVVAAPAPPAPVPTAARLDAEVARRLAAEDELATVCTCHAAQFGARGHSEQYPPSWQVRRQLADRGGPPAGQPTDADTVDPHAEMQAAVNRRKVAEAALVQARRDLALAEAEADG
jgi:hypothetical protein